MTIYPAIDLLDGKCVRLYKGDYNKSEQVANDPIDTAKAFIDAGAKWLHVIDLNGAKDGGNPNFSTIEKLAKLPLKVQTGGGVRSIEQIERSLNAGVNRVILGSSAVKDRNFLIASLKKFKEKIVAGVDMLAGTVRTEGWLQDSELSYISFSKELEELGVKTIVFTDISKDGTLQGVNQKATIELQQIVSGIDIIASGGIKDINDVIALKNGGIKHVILGKSLYAKTILLKEALNV